MKTLPGTSWPLFLVYHRFLFSFLKENKVWKRETHMGQLVPKVLDSPWGRTEISFWRLLSFLFSFPKEEKKTKKETSEGNRAGQNLESLIFLPFDLAFANGW
jgi:hypothetical protein